MITVWVCIVFCVSKLACPTSVHMGLAHPFPQLHSTDCVDVAHVTSQCSTDEHLGSFLFFFFSTRNHAAVNIPAQMSLCACANRNPRDKFLEGEVLAQKEHAFMS